MASTEYYEIDWNRYINQVAIRGGGFQKVESNNATNRPRQQPLSLREINLLIDWSRQNGSRQDQKKKDFKDFL